MAKSVTAAMCPNCGNSPVHGHPENGCILATMITVVRERGNKSEEELEELHAKTDVNALWNDLGPILDKLEEGGYSTE